MGKLLLAELLLFQGSFMVSELVREKRRNKTIKRRSLIAGLLYIAVTWGFMLYVLFFC